MNETKALGEANLAIQSLIDGLCELDDLPFSPSSVRIKDAILYLPDTFGPYLEPRFVTAKIMPSIAAPIRKTAETPDSGLVSHSFSNRRAIVVSVPRTPVARHIRPRSTPDSRSSTGRQTSTGLGGSNSWRTAGSDFMVNSIPQMFRGKWWGESRFANGIP